MVRLHHFERADFLANYWPGLYTRGEHVGFIEPTGQGKTRLAWQLLEVTLAEQPEGRFASLMPKPRDPPTREWAERLDLAVTDVWPPAPRLPFQHKPRGHVLWPKHVKSDIGASRERLTREFRKCLHDMYWRGNSIVLADDIYLLCVILGLNMDCEEWWTSGQSMRAGLWAPNQKPSGTIGGGSVSSFSYNAPAHLFLGHDPDQRNQRRFSEIGGIDPALVAEAVRDLPVHRIITAEGPKNISDKLYISKAGYMCTIGV